MKNRKRNYNNFYTPGRNMFGEKAKTELIVLQKGSALEQMLAAVSQFGDFKRNGPIEYTFDASCFSDAPEEYAKIMARVEAFLSFKAHLKGHSFYSDINIA